MDYNFTRIVDPLYRTNFFIRFISIIAYCFIYTMIRYTIKYTFHCFSLGLNRLYVTIITFKIMKTVISN